MDLATFRLSTHRINMRISFIGVLAVAMPTTALAIVMHHSPSASLRTPVLIELFTSEGCSSCPPADRLLERFDRQPIEGAELIVLSEHVDDWNHIGWKDPYSAAFYSTRQKIYGDRFHLDGVYTPQMVIDGASEFVGSDAAAANKAIENALREPKLEVKLSLIPAKSDTNSQLQVTIGQLQSSFGVFDAEVYVAYALNRTDSQVSAGENAGHKLTHVSVVKKITKIGNIKNGTTFFMTLQLDRASDIDRKNERMVVFVQRPHQGRMIGAGLAQFPTD